MIGIRRFAKEYMHFAIGIDEALWKESSIFEKIGHVIATAIITFFYVVIPAVVFALTIIMMLEG